MADMDRLIAMEKAKLDSSKKVEAPYWLAPIASAIQNIPVARQQAAIWNEKENERSKNAVISGINLLPDLAGLIRNEDDLVNYENTTADLTKKASRHTETAPYAPFISGVARNLREDYEMYTKTMESGAKFIDNPNFITDMQGWDDLENTVAEMTLEDGKTPKYQGNGTSLFLTEQNNAINSLIGRIKNSSKGTQFRYNKAGNKYTDAEMIKNLEDYQARLGIALEASMGDGIITKEEAESIMLGDLGAYQTRKKTALTRIGKHYDKLDAYQQKLLKDLRTIELKPSGFDLSSFIDIKNIENADIVGKEDKYDDGSPIEGLNIDTSLSPTSKEDVIKQMQDQIATINLLKQGYKKSHVAWSGESFRPKVTVSKKEQENLLKNIKIDAGGTSPLSTQIVGVPDQGKGKIDVATVDKGKVEIQKTDFDEKRFSNQPDAFPELKKAKGKFVFSQNGDLKEWDNTAYIKGFDEKIPVLNAGYDKYYWHNGKWRHITSAKRKAPIAPKRVSEESKYEREVALEEASKDIKNFAKKLGYSDVGDATKKTKGKPVAENVYNYSKSIWDKLPKEIKAQFGSFNAFMEAVIEQQSTGLEIITE